MTPPILSAICEHTKPIDNTIFGLLGDLRSVELPKSFLDLEVREQLIVIKSAIFTHRNLLKFSVPCYGRILYYELKYQTEDYTILSLFSTKGRLISSTETKHENPLVLPNVTYDLPN